MDNGGTFRFLLAVVIPHWSGTGKASSTSSVDGVRIEDYVVPLRAAKLCRAHGVALSTIRDTSRLAVTLKIAPRTGSLFEVGGTQPLQIRQVSNTV
jgi:hypothetical protein